MAITRLQDIIAPEVFTPYVIRRTMERSELYDCGVIKNDASLDAAGTAGGTLINLPYFDDLGGESDIMRDDGRLSPSAIYARRDVARKLARTKAWGATGLSAELSGADPMAAVAERAAEWWKRDLQRALIAILKGAFGAPSMAGKTLDISGKSGDAAKLSASAFIDANQLMGDAKGTLTAVMMHSAVEAALAKQQLIEYETDAKKSVRVPYYLGKRVIIDDMTPYDAQTHIASLYLFGEGAVALGNGHSPQIIETEVFRDRLASSGEDYLINRRVFLLHPRGVKWTEASVADIFPDNAELSDPQNWERVYEEKAIRMVKLVCKVA